jgi:GxxExxY protein
MNEAAKTREGTRRMMERDNLPFADEVYRIIGAAMEVHSRLGFGFLEAVYEEALAIEFGRLGIPFKDQIPIEIQYRDQVLNKHYVCDFLVFDQIIIEIKAIPQLGNLEVAQILNYLKATGKPLGLLINFGRSGNLEWRRMVLGSEAL